jgi:adenosylcobinamide kinase / adenosylcobinamide-phosphate guanylyltransferase
MAGGGGFEHFTLIIGGARSGKSRQAQALAMASAPPWTYIATAEALDEDMRARIAAHRRGRGEGWRTVEAPLDLARALAQAPAGAPAVIDCLTLWLSNLMLAGRDLDAASAALGQAIEARQGPTIAVSNEVGLGIVPETALGRAFRDEAGLLNQYFAARAGTVLLMAAGLPLTVKPAP